MDRMGYTLLHPKTTLQPECHRMPEGHPGHPETTNTLL